MGRRFNVRRVFVGRSRRRGCRDVSRRSACSRRLLSRCSIRRSRCSIRDRCSRRCRSGGLRRSGRWCWSVRLNRGIGILPFAIDDAYRSWCETGKETLSKVKTLVRTRRALQIQISEPNNIVNRST